MADCSLTVSDVYEHATLIGRDIECMVNEYGESVIERIMPKIVYVLEQLEALAEKCTNDQQRIKELMIERESLIIHTKRDEAIQRQLEEKLIYTDGLLSKDKKDLHSKIKKLKQENDCLHDELDKRDNELVALRTKGALPGDVEVMLRMKTTIDEQRDQIRSLNSQMHSQKEDIDALYEHSDIITSLNEKLRSEHLVINGKLKTSADDESSDEMETDKSSQGDNKHETSLQDELYGTNYTVDQEEEEAEDEEDEEDGTKETQKIVSEGLTLEGTPQSGGEAATTSKATSKDPDRPRYTLTELQKLLDERNIYKDKMISYAEELQLYKDGSLKITSSNMVSYERRPGGVRNLMQKFLGR